MKLSTVQSGRFYRLYEALLTFALPRIDELGLAPEVEDIKDTLALVDITRRLWGSPQLLDAFIRENPANFDAADLAIIEQWKSALFGIYHIVLMPYHESFFLKEGNAFSVSGLEVQVDEMFDEGDQAIVFTTLLPFEDAIIFAGELFPTGLPVGANMHAEAYEEVLAKKATGDVFATANDLIAAAPVLCA